MKINNKNKSISDPLIQNLITFFYINKCKTIILLIRVKFFTLIQNDTSQELFSSKIHVF